MLDLTVVLVGRAGSGFQFTSSWFFELRGCCVVCCLYWCCCHRSQQACKHLGKWTVSSIVNMSCSCCCGSVAAAWLKLVFWVLFRRCGDKTTAASCWYYEWIQEWKKVFYFRGQRESCRQMCYKLLRDTNYNCVYRSMDPNEALCQLNYIMYSAVHISCPTRQVTVRDRDPIYVTPAVKLLLKQRNKQLRKQNAAKVKELNERIRKLVQKNCRILDKVGSRNWWKLINSLSKDKQPASPVNVDVNNLNRYFISFSNDPNSQPQLEKKEFQTGENTCFYLLEVYHYLKKRKQTSHVSSGLLFWI